MSIKYDDDNLSFTKQTAMILEGLGAGDVLCEFKKRNISTPALSQLSKEDFITLGVNDDLAEVMVKQLGSGVNKQKRQVTHVQNKSTQFIDILKSGRQQLALIQHFITYTRLKLGQKSTDYIIDVNNNIRASEALCTATNCAILEISNLEEQLHLLLSCICEANAVMKPSRRRLYTTIGGIGLSACLLYTWNHVVRSIKQF